MYPAACKAGLRNRLPAKQDSVSGWQMLPNVYRLIEVGHAISYSVHREYGL